MSLLENNKSLHLFYCKLPYYFAILLLLTSCSQKLDRIESLSGLWIEGENFNFAPNNTEKQISICSPASNGQALDNSVFTNQHAIVGYDLEIKAELPKAKIVLRYARFHFSKAMHPALISIRLQQDTTFITKQVYLSGTGGWGEDPGQFVLLESPLGRLSKGKWQLTLTSLTSRSNITLDGFYILPDELKLATQDLNSLGSVNFFNTGYYGLQQEYPVINQKTSGEVKIKMRFFNKLKNPNLLAEKLTTGLKTKTEGHPQTYSDPEMLTTIPVELLSNPESDPIIFKLDLKRLSDGVHEFSFPEELLPAHCTVQLLLAGNLFNKIDSLAAQSQKIRNQLKKSRNNEEQKFRHDLQGCADYLQTRKQKLITGATFWDNFTDKENKGTKNPTQIINNLQRTSIQLENMLTRYELGKKLYPTQTGLSLHAFYSSVSKISLPYHLYTPQNYLQQTKVPCILLLHGGGGDEDYFTDLEAGELLRVLENYGYIGIMPRWDLAKSREDLFELLQTVRHNYPKIDSKQIFCSGISMGSFRALYLAFSYPGLFKALACVSGMVEPKLATKISFPLLIIHGGLDIVVPLTEATEMAEYLKNLNKPFELKIFPASGHGYQAKIYLPLTLDFFNRWGATKNQ